MKNGDGLACSEKLNPRTLGPGSLVWSLSQVAVHCSLEKVTFPQPLRPEQRCIKSKDLNLLFISDIFSHYDRRIGQSGADR